MMSQEEPVELKPLDKVTAESNRRRRKILLQMKRGKGSMFDSVELPLQTQSEPVGVSERILKIRESASTARQKAKERLRQLEKENRELEEEAKELTGENDRLEKEIQSLRQGGVPQASQEESLTDR